MNKIALIAGVVGIVVIAGGYVLLQKTGSTPAVPTVSQQRATPKKPVAVELPPQPEPPPPPPAGTPNPGKALNEAMRAEMLKRAQELQKKNAVQQPPAPQPAKP